MLLRVFLVQSSSVKSRTEHQRTDRLADIPTPGTVVTSTFLHSGTCGSQKKVLNSMQLELHIFVKCNVDTGNQTPGLIFNSKEKELLASE